MELSLLTFYVAISDQVLDNGFFSAPAPRPYSSVGLF